MKTSLASLEISYILKELDILIGSKVDKIYNIGNEILFSLHIPNLGKKILRIVPGKFLFLGSEKESSPEPNNFCMILRRNLDNARLRQINQKTPERIVEFTFEKEETKKVYAEFFSQGNIILCNNKNEIITAQILKSWKERAILHGKKYDYPKSKYDFFNLKLRDLEELFSKTEKNSVVTCLAIELGLGGIYSEEVCLTAGINKNISPKSLKEKDFKKLISAINLLKSNKISAQIVLENNLPKDVVPFSLGIYEKLGKKNFPDYNSAVEFFYLEYYRKVTKEKSPHEKEIERLDIMIKSQEEKINETILKEVEERKKAEMIYNNYKLLDELISEIRKASEKYSWHEIKEKLKGHKIIKEVNPVEKSVVVELDD